MVTDKGGYGQPEPGLALLGADDVLLQDTCYPVLIMGDASSLSGSCSPVLFIYYSFFFCPTVRIQHFFDL